MEAEKNLVDGVLTKRHSSHFGVTKETRFLEKSQKILNLDEVGVHKETRQ